MFGFGALRALRLRGQIREQEIFYGALRQSNEIARWQLESFNRHWPELLRTVPYLQRLSKELALPRQFSGWQAFRDALPITDRKTLQENRQAIADASQAPDYWRSTGGSTAEPIQIPAWNSEIGVATRDIWYARKWFGIAPADRLFLLWGHSHLLGSDIKGRLNSANRRLKDAMLGYCRFSAYDLSAAVLRTAADRLLAFKPAYLLAYAAALDRFARVNQDRRAAFHKLNLKVAIATAESFPTRDSAGLIEDVLGCPVAMEYGAVETGPIAHQRRRGGYGVFWRHYYVESIDASSMAGAREILVTSLYPRCVPLVRYKIGDLITINPNGGDCAQEFESVIGRCNDYVVLPNGALVHSEAFSHAVKDLAGILAYQVVQESRERITLRCVGAPGRDSDASVEIQRRLERILPGITGVQVQWVDALEQTIAGKSRRIVRAA